ncbi:MAG: GFA family protein [Cypionkella sp.]
MSAMFDEALEGGCVCGAVRYTLSPGFRIGPYACHCTRCQTRTDSAFAEHMMVARSALVATGAAACGTLTNPSGARITLWGCTGCGTSLWGENSTRPGSATVRCGSLDRSAELVPVGHIWVSSKQPWIALPPGAKALAEQPRSPDEWVRELGQAA